jgi:hypothetical protein
MSCTSSPCRAAWPVAAGGRNLPVINGRKLEFSLQAVELALGLGESEGEAFGHA